MKIAAENLYLYERETSPLRNFKTGLSIIAKISFCHPVAQRRDSAVPTRIGSIAGIDRKTDPSATLRDDRQKRLKKTQWLFTYPESQKIRLSPWKR